MAKLTISLLGAPEFGLNGAPFKISIRRNIALLAYLAVTRESHSREALVALLWPDHEPRYARAGLRRNLSVLKKSLGGEFLGVEREIIRLDPDADIRLDIEEFRSLAAKRDEHKHPIGEICPVCLTVLKHAVGLYRGDFMEGFGLPDTPGFDEWQYYVADGLRQELISILEDLVHTLQTRGDHKDAITFARRWIHLDKLSESAHRELMSLYANSNQRGAALRQYGECERILQEELGVPPESETRELYQAIKQQREISPLTIKTEPVKPSLIDDRYQLADELGRGGTGVVYSAYDTMLDRKVAIKVMPIETLGIEGGIRLLEEAQAAAKLNHPNIVSIYDAGQAGDASYIVMEHSEGKSLSQSKSASLDVILSISRQICFALEYAHAQGIVHRDLKPENIILASDGTAKLTDFGLARPVASRITSAGQIIGTVFYLAPEVALGQDYDGRADLYALGVMLYELTTGKLPFAADDPIAVITQHIHAPVVPPRARNADIPPALETLILNLMNKAPQDRPGSASEVIDILDTPDILDREPLPDEELSVLKRIGRGRLVARESELSDARILWNRAILGQGQMLLVSGEPGIGKTRFVREITTQVQITGGRVFIGACYAEGGTPYAPYTQILRSAFVAYPIDELNLPDSVLAGLRILLPDLQAQLPQIKPVNGLDDPKTEQHRLFESLALTFASLSERNPLLMVVEDIHWADSGTLHLLRYLVRHARKDRIMVVTTFRDVVPVEAEIFHEMLLDLRREGLAKHLKLPRLDREQSEEMLGHLFAEEITPEFLDGIYDETEGNPFYIEEVCKALVESGKLYFQDGRWQRPSVEELGIPQSVRVAIQSRVRVLSSDTQEILLTAAVLGREFDLDTLIHACDLDGVTIVESLELGESAQLIEKVHSNGTDTYTFVHSLIPTTLVESTRASKRRHLHLRAANALEIFHPYDYEALAFHFHCAGEAEKAVDYLLKTGDKARGLYTHQEAISSYLRALDLLKKSGDLERASRTYMKLGLTYHNAFDFESARQAYHDGFVLWQRMADLKPPVPGYPPPAPHALRVTTVEPVTLGLGLSMDLIGHMMYEQLFSGLVEVSPDLGVVPDVARSWEVFDGGRKYVFHLRDDVYWSDGVQVTAHDFEFTWKRTLDPTRDERWYRYLLDIKNALSYHNGEGRDHSLAGVRALDKFTLVVELEGPTSYFPYLMAFVAGFPMPAHVIKVHGDKWVESENIVTNGPFRLATWTPGESIILERNPAYHGRITGNLQQVECLFLSNQPSRALDKYSSDKLDICSGLPLLDLARAREHFAGDYVSSPWMSTNFLCFNVRNSPFDDLRVRRAFAMATDREMLADLILRGYTFPATGGFVPPGMPGHSPNISLDYNPKNARQLMLEAGYPEGQGFPEIECLARDDPGHELACEYLQSQWSENLGVKITWKLIRWVDFYDLISVKTPHMWMTSWYADYPDPDDVLRINWWIGFTGWNQEAFHALVAGARRVMDQEERMSMYQQADKILVEEAPLLPLCYGRFHMLVKPWVKKFSTSSLKWWSWKDVIIEPHLFVEDSARPPA